MVRTTLVDNFSAGTSGRKLFRISAWEEGRRKRKAEEPSGNVCYGIKIYAFMIEPRWLDDDKPAALNNPESADFMRDGMRLYIIDGKHICMKRLLSSLSVPGLGGVRHHSRRA